MTRVRHAYDASGEKNRSHRDQGGEKNRPTGGGEKIENGGTIYTPAPMPYMHVTSVLPSDFCFHAFPF